MPFTQILILFILRRPYYVLIIYIIVVVPPVLSHLNYTLFGLITIRALKAQEKVRKQFDTLLVSINCGLEYEVGTEDRRALNNKLKNVISTIYLVFSR